MRRFLVVFLLFLVFPEGVKAAPTSADWFMAGANPQRTSWVTEEVRGNLNVEWYQPIEPYIPYKIQPVFYNGVAYISTSKGLYAFDLGGAYTTGQSRVKWVYPTELPLGHSPTIANINGIDVAYVGGFDHKIHAINTSNGQALQGYTPFEAGAGFETNPLVVGNMIYVGNRDGKFYALNATTGAKVWEFQTGGAILFSAAHKNGVVYFASNDLYAYALNATTGAQIWKSPKFQYSAGFFSYWPVVYTEKLAGKDYVIFTGAENYRNSEIGALDQLDQNYFNPGCRGIAPYTCPPGVLWPLSAASSTDLYFPSGTSLMDLSTADPSWSVGSVREYYEDFPHRRMIYALDAANGQEYSFDSDSDGKKEYPPLTYSGVAESGTKYPPVINGLDRILYNMTMYFGGGHIGRGDVVGWKWGSHIVSRVATGNTVTGDNGHAVDEPMAVSSGGRIVYENLCCDREAQGFDVTIPFGQANRAWQYFSYDLHTRKAPDYQMMYNDGDSANYNNGNGWQIYSGKNQSKNGVYGKHMTSQSPPIPYQGKLYFLRGNALLAFSPTGGATKLSLASTVTASSSVVTPSAAELIQKLENEINKMDVNGDGSLDHFRPGFHSAGFVDLYAGSYTNGQDLGEIWDYFQNPSDTVFALLSALPYLNSSTQSKVRTYLQNNYGPGRTYDITKIVHIGWGTGAPREGFAIPPENYAIFGTNYQPPFNPSTLPVCGGCGYWKKFPPFSFYAAWKYAKEFGGAKAIFDSMTTNNSAWGTTGNKLEAIPSDLYVTQERPYMLNLYLAGYLGYLELQKLAGYPESSTVRAEYTRLLNLKKNNFTKDNNATNNWFTATNYGRSLSVARNFMFLTPEIADFMSQNLYLPVQTALGEYQYVAPYWFVNKFDGEVGEGTLQHLYDSPALFQAKAYILKQPYNELVKWLDAPAFERGDLFYIQNLVAALDVASYVPPSPIGTGDVNSDGNRDTLDLKAVLAGYVKAVTNALNQYGVDSKINSLDFVVVLKRLP